MSGLAELKRKIDERPGTRADFARAVEISEPYLSQILNGARPLGRLPGDTLLKISREAGIPIDHLVDTDHDASPRKRRAAV
jgi:transcriptional regulator with XRE-family HTH domain